MVERRVPGLRLSMLDLIKIVVACSAATACITPSSRLVQAGIADLWSMAAIDAIIIPLVFVLACYLMVKRGPRRDAMVAGLILFAVSVALAIIARSVWPIANRFVHYGPLGIRPMEHPALAMGSLALAGLGGLATWLGFRLWRLSRIEQPGASERCEVRSRDDRR